MGDQFMIVDVRAEWRHKPYITLWRPDDAGYAYPLPWAGRYSRERIDEHPSYYATPTFGNERVLERYPVPVEAVERLAIPPTPGMIDGDTGPVLKNDARTRRALRRAAYVPSPSHREEG